MSDESVRAVQRELYECLTYWGTLPEPEGDVPERYNKWEDLGEIAERLLTIPAIKQALDFHQACQKAFEVNGEFVVTEEAFTGAGGVSASPRTHPAR
jgi:hypothetical protein